MSLDHDLSERYSICLVSVDKGYYKDFFKYYRIADYNPRRSKTDLTPSIGQAQATSLEEIASNPDYIYNPQASYHHDSRDSDFYLLKWRLDPQNGNRQITSSVYDDPGLREFGEPREVFVLDEARGERDLRRALSDGFPFEGKTTSSFYVVYGTEKGRLAAVVCNRDDFVFTGSLARLSADLANARSTVLSAPKVLLDGDGIIEPPCPQAGNRKIYHKLGDLTAVGRVLLRSLDYYASDYVKWFLRESEINLSRSEKQDLTRVIDSALSRPKALERYLGAGVPDEEIESFRKAIRNVALAEGDQAKALVRKAVLEDDAFRKDCVEQALKQGGEALARKRAEIGNAENVLGKLLSEADETKKLLDARNEEKKRLEGDIAELEEELENLQGSEDDALAEIQANLALRLGLGAAASSRREFNADGIDSGPCVIEGATGVHSASDEHLGTILASNLKALGAVSLSSDSSVERKIASTAVLSALSTTSLLAAPLPIAEVLADALCIGLSGATATRVWVPADFRGSGSILELVNKSGSQVVLVENVIDSVNEGILNILLHSEVRPIVVFPFLSHESARLIAKESWAEMFFLPIEPLSVCKSAKKEGLLKRCKNPEWLTKATTEDVLDSARSLKSELDGVRIADGCALLVASIIQAAECLSEDDSAGPVVSQHIAMSSALDAADFDAISEWAGGDCGLSCLSQVIDFARR